MSQYGKAPLMSTPRVLLKQSANKPNDRNTDRALQILSKLAARGNVWPHGCAVAIRDLRSTLDETRGDQRTGQRHLIHGSSHSGDRSVSSADDGQGTATPPSTERAFSSGAESPLTGQALYQSRQGPTQQDVPAPQDTTTLDATGGQALFYPEAMLGNSWLDLGMDLRPDLSSFPNGGLDPLQGFDIPFWVGQDNYATWMGS